MIYESNIYQMTVEDHTFWVAESKSLKGCVGQGETSEEAIKELERNEIDWIETANEVGIPVPEPTAKVPVKHNGKFALRLSPDVYAEACSNAKELDISINQYFCNAIISYNIKCETFLRKTPINVVDGDTASKIVDFSLKASKHKAPKIQSIEELEEM